MDNPENIYLPIFVDLTGKLVVVVGGGMVAAGRWNRWRRQGQ